MTMEFARFKLDDANESETWINWITPRFYSSNIMCVGHDYTEPENNLYVEFLNGEKYIYPDAGWQHAINIMMASSPGTYFAERIRGKMPYHKIKKYEVLKHG